MAERTTRSLSERIHVGTSGWHYAHWRGPFYPEGMKSDQMLAFYCERLSTVEINNSFYRLPTRKTFRWWRQQTPAGFVFAVKASRYITHMKKLKDSRQPLRKFLSHAEALGAKLGPILFQLPPRWRRDTARLKNFLQALPRRHRFAFEFRDPSWFHREVYRLLEQHNAAFCVFDLAGLQSPRTLTADFTYLRLHGPAEQKYAGCYTREQLRAWLRACEAWAKEGAQEVFVYFDNDQAGYAARNALELVALLEPASCQARTDGG
ncbi:MAG: DUF72 domain-containing protein [Acidobacteria bacterium]|nr:DUF72 domain-containing protein [Acidobacteriota bacterium]